MTNQNNEIISSILLSILTYNKETSRMKISQSDIDTKKILNEVNS